MNSQPSAPSTGPTCADSVAFFANSWIRSVQISMLVVATAVAVSRIDCRADQQSGIAQRVPWTTSQFFGTPDPPPDYLVELAFPDLTFEQPLDLAAASGTDRLFVAEQNGKIHSFPNRYDVAKADLVIDLKQHIPDLTALYSITFHPQFSENRFVYVCYITLNEKPDGTHVSRFTLTEDEPPVLDPGSELPLIQWLSGGHNGCSLKFGPEGYLYMSTGDGGAPSPPDPLQAGQDVSNLLSAVLRIDVDHSEAGRNYRIPPDNPFVDLPGARPEIWAYGFRNPWRMSFDRSNGDLWVGDVGWQLWEMIYRVRKGANYGWPVMEGPQPALPEAKKGPTPILPPVISHPHSESASITGGYVYHGKRLAELQGAYIYGDFQTGKIWGLRMSGQQISWKKELAQTPLQLVSFGEDNAGEIYLVDYQRTRQIYRLTKNPHAGERTQFPRRLSETGLFSSTVEQIPASGVTPFVINAPHWADHTMSQRWLAVPGDQPVSVDAEGSLTYPDGSVLAKTVSIEMKHGSPESRRRLETQVLHREQGSWRPYTYLWNEEQTDAVLASADGSDQLLKIQDPSAPEGLREQKYRFAARSECQLCHNAWVDAKTTMMGVQSASPLAMSLSQLNREIPTDGGTQNQLTALHQSGWLNGSIPLTAETSTGFVNPYDTSADLNQRARSYLHVNCAHCHQPHAGGSATIELTISSKLEDARLLGIRPAQGTFGISHASLLAPADPLGSVLYYRVSKLGSGRMPRIGSDEVDTAGVQLIHDWIAAMPPALQNAQVSQTSAVEPAQHASALKTLQANDASGYEPAVHQLCSSTRGALRLLQVLQSPNIPAAARSVVLNVAAAHPQAEVRDLFERFIPMSQRQQKLGTTVQVDQILSLTANPENGRQYFFREGAASCRGCHRVHGSGETLGPDLSQVGKKYGPRDMLSHLLEPSRFMEPKYVPYVLETKSGIVHTGLLVEKSDDAVTLKNIELREIRVPLSDVEHLTTQQKSIMPDLLLRDLTAQQAADLLAFLGTLN